MDGFIYTLLDENDRERERLDGVTGGSIEAVALSAVGGSASVSIDDLGQDIDWMRHRLQVTYVQGDRSWPKGVFLFASPTEQHTDAGVSWGVGLLTKMNIPSEDKISERYSLPVGAPVVPAVVALLQSTGESRIAATSSTSVRMSPYTAKAGTSKLTIINELLTGIGYWSLWCDTRGLFRIEPYLNPEDRPVKHEFVHGEESLHFPDWDREQNHTSVPNIIVLTTEGDEDAAGLIGVAKNDDPSNPYSFQARGDRWIGPEAETVEAESQTVIDQLATRKLADAMSPVAQLKVRHALLDLEPNDLVAFTPEDGRRRLATVQRMSFPLEFDADVSAEWREVL